MKQTFNLFQIGFRQIVKDGMLLVLLPLPFFVGAIFKFALPIANELLEERFVFSLLPWYGLADGMLVCLTPMMVAMISAFLLLDEKSDRISAFYQITPVGEYSYLVARIGIPMIWALLATVVAVSFFHLSPLSFGTMIAGSFISTLTGIALAIMVVSIAENRVEGLAVSKLMGLSFLGLLLIWFLPAPYSYFCSFLPSFWVGKLLKDGMNPSVFFLGVFICCIWIFLFSRRFLRRIR